MDSGVEQAFLGVAQAGDQRLALRPGALQFGDIGCDLRDADDLTVGVIDRGRRQQDRNQRRILSSPQRLVL